MSEDKLQNHWNLPIHVSFHCQNWLYWDDDYIEITALRSLHKKTEQINNNFNNEYLRKVFNKR